MGKFSQYLDKILNEEKSSNDIYWASGNGFKSLIKSIKIGLKKLGVSTTYTYKDGYVLKYKGKTYEVENSKNFFDDIDDIISIIRKIGLYVLVGGGDSVIISKHKLSKEEINKITH